MSKIEQINAFITVIEENGFAKAARKLGISTPAISRQIARLENSLGAQLLTRTTREISLTETGISYYEQCKKTLAELNEAEMAITHSQSIATGTLTIVAVRYFAINFLIPRLPEFMQENPALKIHFELAERFPNLKEENIDLIFGVSIEGPSELVRKRIATTRYVLCASPDYLKKYGTPEKPSDLLKHHYISHSMRAPDNELVFNGKSIHVNPTLVLNDSQAMKVCALNNMGIIKVHDYVVLDALADGRLVEVLQNYPMNLSIFLYYQQSQFLLPKIRRFIDFFTT